MSFLTVAAATLPSVPLDFQGNRDRVLESIRIAKAKGATLRTGPELEIPGYGCLDHHLEGDTFAHSWEVLADIISNDVCKDMLVDIGMGCRHRNVRYNCRVLCTYKKILFIRPKMSLANDGLYREARHFTAWVKPMQTETYYLEQVIEKVTGQRTVPIGDAILSTRDTAIGCETCEELFTPRNPSTYMSLNGCEIILNSSASHAELRKLKTRLDLIANSTRKTGGCYVYANATGIDGEARMMFDGSSMILLNGKVLEQGNQFSLEPVEVVTATIDLEEIRSFRASISRNVQAAAQPEYPRVEFDMRLCRPAEEIFLSKSLSISTEKELHILDPMSEIWMSTSVYLWQYLVRTSSAGFFLSLSGGLDSSTVALFVYGMAKVVISSIEAGSKTTWADLKRVTGLKDEDLVTKKRPEDIVNLLLDQKLDERCLTGNRTTCYMGTVNSSEETCSRAQNLADKLGAWHLSIPIDEAVQANLAIIEKALKFTPKYEVDGGTKAENTALQNIQARSRLVTQYSLAQLATTARQLPRAGSALLVLTSGNVDENLRGYYTKYDAMGYGSLGSPYYEGIPRGNPNCGVASVARWCPRRRVGERNGAYLCGTLGVWNLPKSRETRALVLLSSLTWSLERSQPHSPADSRQGDEILPELCTQSTQEYNLDTVHPIPTITVMTFDLSYSVIDWPLQFGKIRAHAEQLEKALKEQEC
ncbi:hypothetical protein O1611_g7262 [Lasiodiplodia mahajangana]|uniref:Uncharacterized protein n=1 Tax=Lasiodiplodia mahajangana TaxID=1108764 RepID=A0ACC2JG37_9PEZI|nr:hypothetical protein O1611_g7262 [Lasiodiplodia mahajangana]